MRGLRRVVAAAIVLASAAGVGSPAEANPNVVVAVAAQFAPAEIVVVQGTKLTFVNADDMFHDVTAEAGEFSSATIGRGVTAVHGVEHLTPNTYSYYCTVHEDMWGLITVV